MDGEPDNSGRSSRGTPLSPARFAELQATFDVLRQDGQALVRRLRGSIHEMRRLRTRLTDGRMVAPDETLAVRLESDFGLTTRELDVALLLARGHSNAAIAKRLAISPHTVRHHTQKVLAKLGVHSRSAAGARLRDL
jgi:DNA-binding CsgD family transcriptional regulator